MRPRRPDSTTCAMGGPGFHRTLLLMLLTLLLLIDVCSAAPYGGSSPITDASPMAAETLSHHNDGQPTRARYSGTEEPETTAWITEESAVSELTIPTAATAGDPAAPTTTTDLPWSTHSDQEGTTTTTTAGDDHAEAAATTQAQTSTEGTTLPTGAPGGLEESPQSRGVTAEAATTAVTGVLMGSDDASTGAGTQCRDCSTPGREQTDLTEAEPLQEEATRAPGQGSEADMRVHQGGHDPANPYDHFDSDSEEQEFEVEMEHHPQAAGAPRDESEEASWLGGLEYEDSLGPGPGTTEPQPATTQRSYLLQLAGNSTIVMLRRSDFAKYLKLNLAARLSLEYDNVKVNRVLLEPPRLLVNVSVVTPDGGGGGGAGAAGGGRPLEDQQEEPLHALAEANATLLELSGEEYHVVRMLPLRARKSPRGDAAGEEEADGEAEDLEAAERYSDGELAAYCVLGGACAVAAVGALLLASARYLRGLAGCLLGGGAGGGSGGGGGEALLQSFLSAPWRLRHDRMAAAPGPPSVIYSGSLADATACWTAGLQPPPPPPQQQSPPTTAPAASRLRLFGCRSSGLLLPPTKELLQPLSTPAGHENPAYRE